MNRFRTENGGRKALDEIRRYLHEEVGITPGHMADERDRLMSRSIREEVEASSARDWTGIAFAGLFGVAVVAVLLFVFFPVGEPQVSDSSVVSLAGYWLVEPGDRISSGQLVRVRPNSGAKVAFADDTTLWLDSGTALKYSTNVVRLEAGCILASVASRREGTDFRIETSLGTVIVHGTTFAVCAADSGMWVALYQGRVSINSDTSLQTIIPGQYVEIPVGGIPVTRPIEPEDGRPVIDFAQKCASLPGRPIPIQLISRVWNTEDADKNAVIRPTRKNAIQKAAVVLGKGHHAVVLPNRAIVEDAGIDEEPPFYVPDGIIVESGEAEESGAEGTDSDQDRFPTPEEAAETMRINGTQELLKLFPPTGAQR
jgi:FecR-like protein